MNETTNSPATLQISASGDGLWLVTLDHPLNSIERITLSLRIRRDNRPVGTVQADLIDRAIQILQDQRSRLLD